MLNGEITAAARVVAIQNILVSAKLAADRRRALLDEQRRLWDSEFQGKPFDAIAAVVGAEVQISHLH